MVNRASTPSVLAAARAVALVLVAALLLAVGWTAREASASAWVAVAKDGPALSAQEAPNDGFFLPRAPALVTVTQPERPAPPPDPMIVEVEVAAWPLAGTRWLVRIPPPSEVALTGPRSPRTPTGPPDA